MSVWTPVRAASMEMAACWPDWSHYGAAVWREGDVFVSCRIGESAEDRTHDIERHGSDRDTARAEALALWCPR